MAPPVRFEVGALILDITAAELEAFPDRFELVPEETVAVLRAVEARRTQVAQVQAEAETEEQRILAEANRVKALRMAQAEAEAEVERQATLTKAAVAREQAIETASTAPVVPPEKPEEPDMSPAALRQRTAAPPRATTPPKE
jgi:5'-deoxynucleotidase YfbR-like HD superfamily hydrolase